MLWNCGSLCCVIPGRLDHDCTFVLVTQLVTSVQFSYSFECVCVCLWVHIDSNELHGRALFSCQLGRYTKRDEARAEKGTIALSLVWILLYHFVLLYFYIVYYYILLTVVLIFIDPYPFLLCWLCFLCSMEKFLHCGAISDALCIISELVVLIH